MPCLAAPHHGCIGYDAYAVIVQPTKNTKFTKENKRYRYFWCIFVCFVGKSKASCLIKLAAFQASGWADTRNLIIFR
jgi:hypothetical protein